MKKIFSLGTSNRDLEEFRDILLSYHIQLLVDVRRFPTSRYAHFNQKSLATLCADMGISYRWLGDLLGGFRSGGYGEYMNTDTFKRGMCMLCEWAQSMTTVVCCAERLPWKCHRRFIGFHLMEKAWQVIHIIDRGNVWMPHPSPGFG